MSSCSAVWLVCWLSPHTSAVHSVGQAGFVFAQHPSTKYNPGHCLQHQESPPPPPPPPWQQGLKHAMACNSFIPLLDFTSSLAPESKPARIRRSGGDEPRCYTSPLECAFCWGSSLPQPPPPMPLNWHCSTSTSLVVAEVMKSVSAGSCWLGFPRGKGHGASKKNPDLTAEESVCGNYGACLLIDTQDLRVFLSSRYPSCTITASVWPLCHSSKLSKTPKNDVTNPGNSSRWGMTGSGRGVRAAKLVSWEFPFWELQEENTLHSRG